MNAKVQIGIVENDEGFRDRVLGVLNPMQRVEEVHHWDSAEQCLRDKTVERLELIFLDIGLPNMDGVELCRRLAQNNPNLKIVMLTSFSDNERIFAALKAGALGYLWKSELEDLENHTNQILDGGAVLTPSIAVQVLKSFHFPVEKSQDLKSLTEREKQVLEEITQGATPREIGSTLGTSEGTVRVQLKSVYRKLQVNSRVELMRKASNMGLL